MLPVTVTDPDGNLLSLRAENALPGFPLPEFVSFTDSGNGSGTFRFRPTTRDRGDYGLVLFARDDGDGGGRWAELEASYTFVVTVQVPDDPPVFDYIGDRVAVANEPFELVIRARDQDQEPLQFAMGGLPASATLTAGAVYGTAVLSWTPTTANLGQHTVVFTVTDGGNGGAAPSASDTSAIALRVKPANASPVLPPILDQTVREGELLRLAVNASDPDGDVLTYSAENLPSGATLDPASGVLEWTPGMHQAGSYFPVRILVTDGHSGQSDTFDIQVVNVNRAPQIVPRAPLFMQEGATLSFVVTAGDADSDPLFFSAAGVPQGARLDEFSGAFTWTPHYEQAGTYTVVFTATDPGGLSDSMDMEIRIDNVNRTPVVDTSYHAVRLGSELRFFIQATDPDLNTTLTYFGSNLPEGASLDPNTGEFVWAPGPGQAGEHVVALHVSDGRS